MANFGCNRRLTYPKADCHLRPLLAGKRSLADRGALNLCLFSHLKSIVDLDAQIANCAFQLRMPEQQLYSPKILRPSAVSGRKLGPPSGKQSLHSLNIRSRDILIKVNIFQLFKEIDISGKKIDMLQQSIQKSLYYCNMMLVHRPVRVMG